MPQGCRLVTPPGQCCAKPECHFGPVSGGGTGMGTPQVITGGGSGSMGTMTGGMCVDTLTNCADFGTNVCGDPKYVAWAKQNCAKSCNKCSGTMTGTGTGTMTGTGTGTMTGTGTGTMTGTGTGGTIVGGGTGGGVITGGGMTGGGIGSTGGGTTHTGGTITGGSGIPIPIGGTQTGGGTGGTMTGGGIMTGGCNDVSSNCMQLNQQNSICSNSGSRMYAQTNCAQTCNMCGSTGMTQTGGTVITNPGMGGTMTGGTCVDKLGNCAAYGQGVCSDSKYTSWSKSNCAKYCNKCGGSMQIIPGGGTHTSTGTGTGTGMGGSHASQGCVYKGVVYHQGQQFEDGCTYKCTCDDDKTGKYTCKSKCVQWQLPPSCSLNPPAAGCCCKTPNCPANVIINYPAGYTRENCHQK